MSYSVDFKNQAINLRKKGYSLKDISEKFHIAKSTASVWLNQIKLSKQAQEKLQQKQILGQYKTILLRKKRRENKKKENLQNALDTIKNIPETTELFKLYCSLLWWCEGNKQTSFVRFTSSDVTLITNYLSLLRKGFIIDESKLRVLIHLHTYHTEEKQKRFWSKITQIPLTQFHKSYQKMNTGVRTKNNYQGCIAVTYYDAKIAKELEAIYNAFTIRRGIR